MPDWFSIGHLLVRQIKLYFREVLIKMLSLYACYTNLPTNGTRRGKLAVQSAVEVARTQGTNSAAIVVGAGIAGLLAARAACKVFSRVTLLEQDDFVPVAADEPVATVANSSSEGWNIFTTDVPTYSKFAEQEKSARRASIRTTACASAGTLGQCIPVVSQNNHLLNLIVGGAGCFGMQPARNNRRGLHVNSTRVAQIIRHVQMPPR